MGETETYVTDEIVVEPEQDPGEAAGETMQDKARRGHALFENLKEIIAKRTLDVFALGRILKEVRDGELYVALGYETFTAFLADPDLAFRRTSAYGFIQLHETFVLEYKLDVRDIGQIPYSKLLIIEPYVTPETLGDLLGLARANAPDDLREEMVFGGYRKKPDGTPVEYVSKGLRLFEKYRRLPAADRGEFDAEYRRWNKL